jgi:hypothetical protein
MRSSVRSLGTQRSETRSHSLTNSDSPAFPTLGTSNSPATILAGHYAPNDYAVDGTLAIRHGSCIDVHRALDRRVPEQLLLDFDVGAYSTKQARVGMPKRVPADLADAGTYGCRFDLPVKDALLPARLPFSIRKYPVKEVLDAGSAASVP